MTNTFQKVRCSRCGALRSPDLRIPCELCHSKQIPILGYTYGVERSWFFLLLAVLFAICLLAVVVGAAFVFIRVWSMGSVTELNMVFRSIFM